MLKRLLLSTLLLPLLLLASCSRGPETPASSRTLLVYLCADGASSISSYLSKNIDDIAAHWDSSFPGRVVIYYDAHGDVPRLIDLQPLSDGTYARRVVKEYEEQNSVDVSTFLRVISDMKDLYPAESYALVWGSHADAWVPGEGFYHDIDGGRSARRLAAEGPFTGWRQSRSFGIDGTSRMNVEQIADALRRAFPDGLDYLLWDACYMSSIEVLYALRGTVRYILASCTETPIAGYPYGRMLPYLWAEGSDLPASLSRLCDLYADHFNSLARSFGSIALLDMSAIDPLFDSCRRVLAGRLSEVQALPVDAVYRYPLVDYNRAIFYDLGDYIRRLSLTPDDYAAFQSALSAFVLRKACINPFSTSGDIPADCFSGINVFVPCDEWEYGDYYDTLSWNGVYEE